MISPHLCIAGREVSEPRLSPGGTALGYAVSHGASAMLILDRLDGAPARPITTWPAPRPGRGMFGGCWCWMPDGEAVIYVAADGNLWLQSLEGDTRQLTALPEGTSASSPAAIGDDVVYTVDDRQVWRAEVHTGDRRRLDDGLADFCFDPIPDPSGVTWIEWDVPDMPWDRTRVRRCEGRSLSTIETPSPSVQQARMTAAGLVHLGDADGWLNLRRGRQALFGEPFEHGGPTWGPGQRSYALSPDGRYAAVCRNERGFGRLCVLEIATGEVREVAKAVHGQLSWAGSRLAALRSGARTPTQVVVYDTTTFDRTVIAVGPAAGWDVAALAEPELIELPAADGATLHARLFRADLPTERLIIWVHGGPTDQWTVSFMPRIAYWRARGWNVLVPDHRGSTGHGRAYTQAMRGRWGQIDVADTVAAGRTAHERGWGRPALTVGFGASAGGFTVLNVVRAAPGLLAAAVVAYPVSDLEHLAQATHRFEAHYTRSLIGPLPAALAEHRRRSPGDHPAELVGTPILLIHGTDDPVVPVAASESLADALRAAGGDIELHLYPGEGHGWRRPEHQLDEYRRIESFLARRLSYER